MQCAAFSVHFTHNVRYGTRHILRLFASFYLTALYRFISYFECSLGPCACVCACKGTDNNNNSTYVTVRSRTRSLYYAGKPGYILWEQQATETIYSYSIEFETKKQMQLTASYRRTILNDTKNMYIFR